MFRRRLALAFLFLLTVGFALGTTGLGHSSGADAGWGERGCTCHGANPTAGIGIGLERISDHWVPGQAYQMTLKITGTLPAIPMPVGQNAGGFALDFNAGSMSTTDDQTQIVGGTTLTHTAAGNNVREWHFLWTAPTDKSSVTFKVSVNAVNGNTLSDPADQWNRKEFTFSAGAVPASSAPPPSPTLQSPGLGFALGLVGIALVLFVVARRRP